jgi:hypothetical protein
MTVPDKLDEVTSANAVDPLQEVLTRALVETSPRLEGLLSTVHGLRQAADVVDSALNRVRDTDESLRTHLLLLSRGDSPLPRRADLLMPARPSEGQVSAAAHDAMHDLCQAAATLDLRLASARTELDRLSGLSHLLEDLSGGIPGVVPSPSRSTQAPPPGATPSSTTLDTLRSGQQELKTDLDRSATRAQQRDHRIDRGLRLNRRLLLMILLLLVVGQLITIVSLA